MIRLMAKVHGVADLAVNFVYRGQGDVAADGFQCGRLQQQTSQLPVRVTYDTGDGGIVCDISDVERSLIDDGEMTRVMYEVDRVMRGCATKFITCRRATFLQGTIIPVMALNPCAYRLSTGCIRNAAENVIDGTISVGSAVNLASELPHPPQMGMRFDKSRKEMGVS